MQFVIEHELKGLLLARALHRLTVRLDKGGELGKRGRTRLDLKARKNAGHTGNASTECANST